MPLKNTAFRLTLDGRKNDGSLITTGTGMDTELSGDAGAFADATNEATEIATNSGVYYIDLTAAEMNFDTVVVKTTWTNANATPSVIVLYPQEAGDIRVTLDPAGISSASFATGAIDAAAVATDAFGSLEISAGAITEIQAGLATAASITALNDISPSEVSTEVANALLSYDPTSADWLSDIKRTLGLKE